jgi:hypothetical protein
MSESIIEEVRKVREQHAASMGYDLDQIYADLKAREAQRTAEGWAVVPPSVNLPPESALQRVRFAR